MNIASTRFFSSLNYAAGCFHALIFAYYFTGVEGTQFEEGAVVSNIFFSYKVGISIMVACWLLRRMRLITKIIACVFFVLTGVPLSIYIIFPVIIQIIFGGIWYGQAKDVNFDRMAIADFLSIFVFSTTFLNERSGTFQTE
jgi:hypothetical protein